ncbi:hypothetical protein HY212_01350 [Candidatus Pacearchaeota archaeon]|nr:hypothetical protein [Candidatus Pacearchaeota archaeon]
MKKDNNALIIAIIVILAVLFFGGFGYGMMGYGNYNWMWNMMSGYSGYGIYFILNWILNIAMIVAVILLIVWLIKQIQRK